MESSNVKINEYVQRLTASRTRVLCTHGFYGLLLMHMKFALNEEIKTASTDGEKTYFAPKFLDRISDSELDFVLMHEVLHVVLQHCSRKGDRNRLLFNIACDIVVNSNILKSNNMNIKSITLREFGVSMHIAPDGEEGYLYTAEQVYDMLLNNADKVKYDSWDNHDDWGKFDATTEVYEGWIKHFKDACASMEQRKKCGNVEIPLFAQRFLNELKSPQVDWRTVLNDFVQEDVNDYSFSPPDKRFSDSPFFLPDFNDRIESVKDVLFFVDTSGSVDIEDLTAAYSEIKGAIEQFSGALSGKLAFFDCSVKQPIYEFSDVESLLKVKPVGGGGTNFFSIFKYVKTNLIDQLPCVMIILTDGYADFPKETASLGIPVLWLINNDKVTPPWGRVARIKVDYDK